MKREKPNLSCSFISHGWIWKLNRANVCVWWFVHEYIVGGIGQNWIRLSMKKECYLLGWDAKEEDLRNKFCFFRNSAVGVILKMKEYRGISCFKSISSYTETQFKGSAETKACVLAISFAFVFFLLATPNRTFFFMLSWNPLPLPSVNCCYLQLK